MFITLAFMDMRSQYKRTSFGFGWIAIGVLVFALLIGNLWALIFQLPPDEVIPWTTLGMIAWVAIIGVLTGAPRVLLMNLGLIKTLTLPLPGYVLWFTIKVGVTFIISLLAALPIVLYLTGGPHLEFLWLILTLPLLGTILFLGSLVLAIVGAHFRSLSEIVRIVAIPLFLATPVIWQPAQLGDSTRANIAQLNPLGHWIALVRDPIVGLTPGSFTWVVAAVSVFVIGTLGLTLVGATRRSLVYSAH